MIIRQESGISNKFFIQSDIVLRERHDLNGLKVALEVGPPGRSFPLHNCNIVSSALRCFPKNKVKV